MDSEWPSGRHHKQIPYRLLAAGQNHVKYPTAPATGPRLGSCRRGAQFLRTTGPVCRNDLREKAVSIVRIAPRWKTTPSSCLPRSPAQTCVSGERASPAGRGAM